MTLKYSSFIACVWLLSLLSSIAKPNVVLIISDDQGYGDLGIHGNPILRTPNLDQLGKESTRFAQFYVSPVCAPTRASLMTGRYNYRSQVVDTFRGRAIMNPNETTLAELLQKSGYRTGIFGKWHLGDATPMRAVDQGFSESLVHRGGGLRQAGNRPGGDSYFDPVLEKNGQPVETKGYCTDIFTDAALEFIQKHKERPFFAYVAYNAPHTPLEVPQEDADPYLKMNLTREQFPSTGRGMPENFNAEETAKVYGMISNMDRNIGRILSELKRLNLEENTIVIFMTDNGSQQTRYNGGFRGTKGTVYEGGIRVPFFVRWPKQIHPGEVYLPAAHIDVTPTLLELCEAHCTDVAMDGRSLVPILYRRPESWPSRVMFFQWHRGNEPELFRAFAARSDRWKLVQSQGVEEGKDFTPKYELFDIYRDPYEQEDRASEHPDIVARLKKEYEKWFREVTPPTGYAPHDIYVGDKENPVLLTRQDWRAQGAGWGQTGFWLVRTRKPGTYTIKGIFKPAAQDRTVHFKFGGVHQSAQLPAHAPEIRVIATLPETSGQLEMFVEDKEKKVGAEYIYVSFATETFRKER